VGGGGAAGASRVGGGKTIEDKGSFRVNYRGKGPCWDAHQEGVFAGLDVLGISASRRVKEQFSRKTTVGNEAINGPTQTGPTAFRSPSEQTRTGLPVLAIGEGLSLLRFRRFSIHVPHSALHDLLFRWF